MKFSPALCALLLIATGCQPTNDDRDTPDGDNAPASDTASDVADASASDVADASATAPEPLAGAGEGAPRAPVRLEEKWKASGFNAPEGAAPAPDGGYFISNVAGDGGARDGAGWVSKVSADGEVIAAEFATGMDAPKGMVLDRGILYVADLDRVHMVDPQDGTLLRTIEIEEAHGLNDMTTWNASILVSDSAGGRIWQLSGDQASIWVEDERLAGVNGLLGDGNRLLVATMESGSLYEVNEAREMREIASGMENADGIGLVAGGYLVSSWPGQIWYVSAEGKTHELRNTQEEGIMQNDLSVFDGTVIVPNWMPGTVTAWSVKAAD